MIGAIHALRPVSPGKEVFVAAAFGLVHGLAFATTLYDLNLDGGHMALSILGFNIGIELMQMFVILLMVPWLILLSVYTLYKWIRIGGSLFALLVAIAWIIEQIMHTPNPVTIFVGSLLVKGPWISLALAAIAFMTTLLSKKIASKAS